MLPLGVSRHKYRDELHQVGQLVWLPERVGSNSMNLGHGPVGAGRLRAAAIGVYIVWRVGVMHHLFRRAAPEPARLYMPERGGWTTRFSWEYAVQ